MKAQLSFADSTKINEIIDNSNLLNDNLMTLVFDDNIAATQLVLNIILERADLNVKNVAVQKFEKNPLVNGYDVRLDILAEDSEYNDYDIEIQRTNEGADRRRARFNSATLDQRMLKHRQKFKEIRDSFVIFITENDLLKKGRALSHIDRMILEDNEIFGDGNHIIYVNAAYADTSNDIGKLMHDFRCKDPKKMYFRPLRDGVYHFKKTEWGRARMSKDVEMYANEKAREGSIQGAVELAKQMEMPDQQILEYIMKRYNLSRNEAEKYIEPVYM